MHPTGLLSTSHLSSNQLQALILRSLDHFRNPSPFQSSKPLRGAHVLLAFFEPSTRTRISFERAATLLGATTSLFVEASSSVSKGESFDETIATLNAMSFDAAVVRHGGEGAVDRAAAVFDCAVVNAGQSCTAHPTQALLDAATMMDHWGSLHRKRITIVGDVAHSRVAASDIDVFSALGATVAYCCPEEFGIPTNITPRSSTDVGTYATIDEALCNSDAVVMLRIQRERQPTEMVEHVKNDMASYRQRYALTLERALRHPEVLILHPGPVNEDVEIDSHVLELPHCKVHTQVRHGVTTRMAVLEYCCGVFSPT
jgi:aspartate carbamoyltransferase catalytic subunit